MTHGDLGGDFNAPSVLKINGVLISGTPSAGQSIVATSATAAVWATPSGGGGSGSVTSISSADSNITVTNPTTTPVIALSLTPTLQGLTINNPSGDVTLLVKTSAAGTSNGAYLALDSTSTQFVNIQGKVAGGLKWMIGRAGQSHTTGIHFYTNIATEAFFLGDDQTATFRGNLIHPAGVNHQFATTGAGTQIGTAANQKMAFYGNTAIVQPTGDMLTAIGNLGLVASPTLSIAGIITAGSNVTLSGAGTLASPYIISSTAAGGGGGTVTTASVVSANGFAGTVANATTTPAITLTTSVTGILKGNGTAISAATAGTDYVIPAGNVATATALATARNINGVSFNGTTDITITDATKMALLNQTATKTGAYTAAAGELVIASATTAAFTVTLPTAPADKTIVAVKKIDAVPANLVTIACGGSDTFLTSGGTTTTLSLQGQSILLEYNTAAAAWTSISNDVPLGQLDARYVDLLNAQTVAGQKTFSSDLSTLNTTTDAQVIVKTTAGTKGAYAVLDSTSSSANGILGKINGSLRYIAGRSSSDTTGYHIYTNIAVHAFGIDDSQVATFYGNVVLASTKTLTLSGSGAKITTPNLQINTATASVVGQIWTATDTAGNASWQTLTAAGTVTSVSVVSANGFAGSVATATSTPAITISTSVTGLLKGNGTAISAATAETDYTTPTGAGTITSKRITKRYITVTQSATPTLATDTGDVFSITGLAQAITNVTVTGTPTTGQTMIVEITDDGTARAIAWGTSFESSTITLPPTTSAGVKLTIGFVWNATTSKWRCVGVA